MNTTRRIVSITILLHCCISKTQEERADRTRSSLPAGVPTVTIKQPLISVIGSSANQLIVGPQGQGFVQAPVMKQRLDNNPVMQPSEQGFSGEVVYGFISPRAQKQTIPVAPPLLEDNAATTIPEAPPFFDEPSHVNRSTSSMNASPVVPQKTEVQKQIDRLKTQSPSYNDTIKAGLAQKGIKEAFGLDEDNEYQHDEFE